ncbi:MAG: hypothetical protein ABIJ86_08965 [Spirochaetota bacterium]
MDYPLVTLCMVRDGATFRLAISGAQPHPQRSDAADAALAAGTVSAGAVSAGTISGKPASSKPDAVLDALGMPRSDQRASGNYRAALLRLMLGSALEELS